MSDELTVGILTFIVTTSTFVISAIIQGIRDRSNKKHERLLKISDYKIRAYQKIYKELIEYRDYFMLFVNTANEFKNNEEIDNFAPLESNIKLRKRFNDFRLFFSNELEIKISELLTSGETLNNLAIYLCGNSESDDVLLDSVEPSCEMILDKVEECIKQIKKEFEIN